MMGVAMCFGYMSMRVRMAFILVRFFFMRMVVMVFSMPVSMNMFKRRVTMNMTMLFSKENDEHSDHQRCSNELKDMKLFP